MARSKDSNWKHIVIIVILYAVVCAGLFWYLSWNKVDTPFAYEFLQKLGISGIESLSDADLRQVWFSVMAGIYGVACGISVLMTAIWNVIFWKAGSPNRKGLENGLLALFAVLHIVMTLTVFIASGVMSFTTSMTLDAYDMLAYNGMFLLNVPFLLSLWLFSPVGMRSSLFKKW